MAAAGSSSSGAGRARAPSNNSMGRSSLDEAGACPSAIIRRCWASANIKQDPHNPRDWQLLPVDAWGHVMHELSLRDLAALRLACDTLHAFVDRHMPRLSCCCWPGRPDFLARFAGLQSLAITGGPLTADERAAVMAPLLAALATLPRLVDLTMTYAGPGALEGVHALSRLTRLAVSNPAGSVRPSAAAAEGAAGGDDDEEQQQQPAEQQLVGLPWMQLPGAVGGSGASSPASSSAASSPASSPRVGEQPQALPAGLARLHALRHLTLEHLLPDFGVLAQLPHLQRLELKGQTMRKRRGVMVAHNPLLGGLGALQGLTCLVARSNYAINRLPDDIGSLTALQHLDISKNMLSTLPLAITRLPLAHLDLSSNCLSVVPDELASLANSLTYLSLSNNSRVALPRTLGALHRLVACNISWVWSDLSALWQGAAGLSQLKVLNVVGNGISEVPPSVGGFKALTALALSMNNLATLPDTLPASLRQLEVSDNRLTELPAALGCLTDLRSLAVRSNCLPGLPDTIGRLVGLTYLDASMNHIRLLPDSLTSLTRLQQLALSMNPLLHLPAGMHALQRLRVLELYYVKLENPKALHAAIPGLYVFSNTLSEEEAHHHSAADMDAAAAEACAHTGAGAAAAGGSGPHPAAQLPAAAAAAAAASLEAAGDGSSSSSSSSSSSRATRGAAHHLLRLLVGASEGAGSGPDNAACASAGGSEEDLSLLLSPVGCAIPAPACNSPSMDRSATASRAGSCSAANSSASTSTCRVAPPEEGRHSWHSSSSGDSSSGGGQAAGLGCAAALPRAAPPSPAAGSHHLAGPQAPRTRPDAPGSVPGLAADGCCTPPGGGVRPAGAAALWHRAAAEAAGGGAAGGAPSGCCLPSSASCDLAWLAARRGSNDSSGSGSADDVAPLRLVRTRSLGRPLLSRHSRRGEPSTSPTTTPPGSRADAGRW